MLSVSYYRASVGSWLVNWKGFGKKPLRANQKSEGIKENNREPKVRIASVTVKIWTGHVLTLHVQTIAPTQTDSAVSENKLFEAEFYTVRMDQTNEILNNKANYSTDEKQRRNFSLLPQK